MDTIRDHLWLWGQSPGTHHLQNNNAFCLPGENRMTPLEGAYYLGIPNMCRVVFVGHPKIPYDREAIVLDTMDRVVWSIADYGDMDRPDDGDADVREVIRQARLHSNVTGVIMDDFFVEKDHLEKYPPAKITQYKQQLNAGVGRPMELWVVTYVHQLNEPIQEHLQLCDVITMWTWDAKDLVHLEENLAQLQQLCPDKRIFAGCYMWDYGGHCEIPEELMRYQLETYYAWIKSGEIDGIIFCSNCVADLGIPAVETARQWIRDYGKEMIQRV